MKNKTIIFLVEQFFKMLTENNREYAKHYKDHILFLMEFEYNNKNFDLGRDLNELYESLWSLQIATYNTI